MKNKKILIGTLIVIVVVVVIAIIFFSNIKSTISVESNDNSSSVTVTAENASEDAGGVGHIIIQEGQKLEVETDLTKASINIEVLYATEDSESKPIIEENLANSGNRTFELPTGEYNILVKAEKGATGSMTINAK